MDSVIEGKLQDPVEALVEEEERKAKEKEDKEKALQQEKELLEKTYGLSLKKVKDMLIADKQKVKNSKCSEQEKKDMTLIIDMLANVIVSEDKDAIDYAFIAYKYMARTHKLLFLARIKKITTLLKDILK
jgi:hypothetical protein